ncbi:pentapeptide repeat-containing protein [Desulfoplanes sp.]
MKKWLVLLLAFVFFGMLGCKTDSDSTESQTKYIQESKLAADPELFAEKNQTVTFFLEHDSHQGSLENDTGEAGYDLIPCYFTKSTHRKFRLEIPENEKYSVELESPVGARLFYIDKNNPEAIVNLEEGVHIFRIEQKSDSEISRGMFICPDDEIVIGGNCPGRNLAGADLSHHNLSNADLSGSDLSDVDFSYADLSNANLNTATVNGATFSYADTSGMTSQHLVPQTCNCASQTDTANCFFVAPQNTCDIETSFGNFTDYTTISFYSCGENGTDVSPKGIEINGTNPQCIMLEANSTWKIVMEDNFYQQPNPCIIKVSDKGWNYASPCDQDDVDGLDLCLGKSVIPAETNARHFAPGCVPFDSSLSSYPRVYILDRNKTHNNILYRGSKPCITNKQGKYVFDYDNIMSVLRSLYKSQIKDGSEFPSHFRFIDISLLNDTGEKDILNTEYTFFGGISGSTPPSDATQPKDSFLQLPTPKGTNATVSGQFRWWNILPDPSGAQTSNLSGLIEWISDLVNTKHDYPYVIYFHCASGSDRTGEVAISYLLKNKKMKPYCAYLYGSTIFKTEGGGSVSRTRQIPKADFLAGAQWYCSQQDPSCNCTYSSMDSTSVPNATCPYPWSSDCDWDGGCQ